MLFVSGQIQGPTLRVGASAIIGRGRGNHLAPPNQHATDSWIGGCPAQLPPGDSNRQRHPAEVVLTRCHAGSAGRDWARSWSR